MLYDLGHVSTAEPFQALFNQGMILGFAYRYPDGVRPKMPALRLAEPPLWRVHPAGEGGSVREARLPLELEFALTDIWKVERPGPLVELYELAP